MHRRFPLLAVTALVVLLSACGGGGGDSSTGDNKSGCSPVQTRAAENGAVEICAEGILFDTKEITAPAGPLKVTLRNTSTLEHNFTIESEDFVVDTPPRKTASGTVTLAPGEYQFQCTVPGHSAMKGKIVVT